MHDKTRAPAENRVKLVLARNGEARVSALLEADELFIAEVPATRPLIEIAAHGRLVPNLRRPNFDGRGADGRIHPSYLCVLGKVNHLAGGADPKSAVQRSDRGLKRALHIDKPIRLRDIVFQSRQKVL